MPAVPTAIQHRSLGVVRTNVALTCDGAGAIAATVIGVGFGRLRNVFYNGGLDASSVITVKDFKSGATLFVYTTGTEGTPTRFCPTVVVTDNAGVAVTAADTAPNVNRPIYLAGKVTITVASGGAAETGVIALVVDESGIGDLALTA